MAGKRNLRRVGAVQEEMAARFLEERGVKITDRNFHDGRRGEIDLIGYDGEALIFVEVKYRSSERAGLPEEAVTPAKQKSIIQTARYYLYTHHIPETRPIRFDVVALRRVSPTQEYVRWIRDAFRVF